MLPVCSTTTSCSSHSQISFHGGLQLFSTVRKDFDSRCVTEDKTVLGFSNGAHVQRMSFKTQATYGVYSKHIETSGQKIYTNLINELKYVDNSSVPGVEERTMDFTITDQLSDNTTEMIDSYPSSTVEIGLDNFLAKASDTIDSTVSKGQSALNKSLDTINSFSNSITKSASKIIDGTVSGVFSAVDQTGSGLKDVTNKSGDTVVDLLRRLIVAAEDSISNGASFFVYSYGSAKELLPLEVRDKLNLSEDTAVKVLRPVGTAFHQVYMAIQVLERSIGLDPNDPIVLFVLFLGGSASFWVLYWVWKYGGYSGDLSPEETKELLAGDKNAVLIDVRPEILRERDGVPDLRRSARFRYTNVTFPEVNGSLRKLIKSGQELDDSLLAVIIRNLKAIQDRSKVIVMDADGSRSKCIARSLRKLGVKRPYVVQGGYQSWTKQGLRVKELRPETAFTILNEEAEAIIESISPVQALGYGVGFIAAIYAALEWETTLQLVGILGLAQTIYRRAASYESAADFQQDLGQLLAPVRVGGQAFSWVAEKLETNGIGLPTSPSSTDVQNRVLQAAAKLESQPTEDPSPDSIAPAIE
ncbi:hypothetical protein ACFE04_007771 [Oxalis oulophora]